METKVEKISNCKRKLIITVSNDDAKKDYLTVFRKYRNNISVPGFRKGKAPVPLIENMYNEQIKAGYMEEYLPKYYQQAIRQLSDKSSDEDKNVVIPLSNGTLEEFSWTPDDELKASFHFEVSPSVELKKYKNFETKFKPLTVTKKMVDNEIRILQENYAQIVEKDSPTEDKDIVYYNIKRFNDKRIEKKEEKTYQIGSKIFGEKFDNALLAVKKGDVISTVIEIAASKTKEQSTPNGPGQSTHLQEPKRMNIALKVNSIKKIVLPELNDEFAKDVGDYDSLENLKNEISKGLEEEVKVKNEKEKHSLILQYIIKENPFELPESFINEYVNDMIKQEQKKNPNMSPEDYQKLKQIYGQYTENELKVYYVLEKLREIEKIEVSDKEVDEEIMKSAKKMNMDVEKYKELYKNQLDRETIKISLANEKILKNIEDTVRFVEAK